MHLSVNSWFYSLLLAGLMLSCQSPPSQDSQSIPEPRGNPFDILQEDSFQQPITQWPESSRDMDLAEDWVDLAVLNPEIIMDLRYATTDNFVESKLYECPRCLLREQVANAINGVHQKLKKQGLGLKMFDCYRPRPVQEALWAKLPDARYVTNPARGSMHNRGAAVDLTIVDSLGRELDMGTGFDYFGNRAYHTFRDLTDEILAHRRLLLQQMDQAGFRHIRTEWWHYSYDLTSYELSDYLWPCP